MKRSHILLALLAIAVIAIAIMVSNSRRTVYVTAMPESLICQPFRSPNDLAAQEVQLKTLKAEPVMDQFMVKAFRAQSEGRGEMIPISNFVCTERLGNMQSARATTYYFSKK